MLKAKAITYQLATSTHLTSDMGFMNFHIFLGSAKVCVCPVYSIWVFKDVSPSPVFSKRLLYFSTKSTRDMGFMNFHIFLGSAKECVCPSLSIWVFKDVKLLITFLFSDTLSSHLTHFHGTIWLASEVVP